MPVKKSENYANEPLASEFYEILKKVLQKRNGSTKYLSSPNIDTIYYGWLEKLEKDKAKIDTARPSYYNRGGIECKDVIDAWSLNFNLGNALKYICRAGLKESKEKDLVKAIQYLQFELGELDDPSLAACQLQEREDPEETDEPEPAKINDRGESDRSLTVDHIETAGFSAAMRGMRNSYKSHDKASETSDHELAMKLAAAGPEHRKYLRQIMCWMDITAPLYWWKQADAYKVGITQNSESTMHTLIRDGVTFADFCWPDSRAKQTLGNIIKQLEIERYLYHEETDPEEKELIEKRVISLLPSSFLQKRTVCVNYETLRNMYQQRKNHKLSEWRIFCQVLESLPYSDLITG